MGLENSSGRGIRDHYGPRGTIPLERDPYTSNISRELRTQAYRVNQLVRTPPTLRVRPYDRAGAITYTSASATVALAEDKIDPMTGLGMSLVTIPANNTAFHNITWEDVEKFSMEPHDSWFLSVYLPVKVSTLTIQILISDQPTISGVNYRIYTFAATTKQIRQGWNVLQCLHVEESIGANQYKQVGTTVYSQWTNNGQQTDTSSTRAIQVRTRTTSNVANDVLVYLGSVHTAPLGWAKAGICWMADDVPESFFDLALPVIESHGWKCALAIASGYMNNPTAGSNVYMGRDMVLDAVSRGHEIWGHTRLHENMDTSTTEEKTLALTAMVQYFNGIGLSSAAKFLAWPFGLYDDESIEIAKSVGIRIARGVQGDAMNPFVPNINRFNTSAYSIEVVNSWHVDSMIRGSVLRGMGFVSYSHIVDEGGSTSDVRPPSQGFYLDHFKRWCDLAASYEDSGDAVVVTPLEYWRLCGVDPHTDALVE